jgi:hypothetical protein
MAPSAGPNMEVAAIGGNNEPWHTSTLDSNVKGFVDRSGWAFGFNRLFGSVFLWRNISVFQHSATDRFLRKLNRRDQFWFFSVRFRFLPNNTESQVATDLSAAVQLATGDSPIVGPPTGPLLPLRSSQPCRGSSGQLTARRCSPSVGAPAASLCRRSFQGPAVEVCSGLGTSGGAKGSRCLRRGCVVLWRTGGRVEACCSEATGRRPAASAAACTSRLEDWRKGMRDKVRVSPAP